MEFRVTLVGAHGIASGPLVDRHRDPPWGAYRTALFIDHGMGIVIGETSEIGDDCTIYHGVTLGGLTWQKGKRHPTLRCGVVIGAGAKVLGPITVGANARIGSNAVVVKDVPECATVVGVPGQIITTQTEKLQKREEMAKKIGFDAYGTTHDMPDPVTNAINSMLDHLHEVEKRLDSIEQTPVQDGQDGSADNDATVEESRSATDGC